MCVDGLLDEGEMVEVKGQGRWVESDFQTWNLSAATSSFATPHFRFRTLALSSTWRVSQSSSRLSYITLRFVLSSLSSSPTIRCPLTYSLSLSFGLEMGNARLKTRELRVVASRTADTVIDTKLTRPQITSASQSTATRPAFFLTPPTTISGCCDNLLTSE